MYQNWKYYRVGAGETAKRIGLAPGSIIGVPSDDAQTFYVLRPMAQLNHGMNHDGPGLLAELAAAGDATELTDVA